MTLKIAVVLVLTFATIIACAAQSEEHMNFSVIGIEYVGESDKPVTPIVISESKAGAAWFRAAVLKRSDLEFTATHVVSVSLMAHLTDRAESYSNFAQKGKNPKSRGTVSVSVITPQRRDTFLLSTEKAVSLLGAFRELCKNDEPLYSDLIHFQKRIMP
ncbi:MAG TPA: hypothetical protein VMJ93_07340 [Verrucomicrobiae bacterium]|nr:hypothetical protein [Verrucomicrobiae bacterium]